MPPNPIQFVRDLHRAYEARTGYTIRWNLHRERQWSEWCSWSDWQWTEADLARVIGYLRGKIQKGERNDGALKFDNLIGQPDRFEEDLNLAKEAAANKPFNPRPKPQPQPSQPQDEEPMTPEERAANFRRLMEGSKPR